MANGKRPAGSPAPGHESGHRRSHRASALRHRGRCGSRRAAAHAGFLKWREVPVVDRVQLLYRYKTLLEHIRGRGRADSVHAKTARRSTTRRLEVRRDDPDGGSRLRHAEPDDGRFAEQRLARHRLHRPSASRSASARASRHSIFRPWCRCGCTRSPSPAATRFILKPSEKVPHDADAHCGTAARRGSSRGRVQPDSRRQRSGGRAARTSAGARDFFRRLDSGGEVHLRDRGEARQTRAGAGRREESPGGDAGREF